jgi:hypothetical protein
LGRPEEALEGFAQVLESYNSLYASDHPAVAQLENLMGQAYVANGEQEKAKPAANVLPVKRSMLVANNVK